MTQSLLMANNNTTQQAANAATMTRLFRAAKRHERATLIREAAGLGLRFTVVDGQAVAVPA